MLWRVSVCEVAGRKAEESKEGALFRLLSERVRNAIKKRVRKDVSIKKISFELSAHIFDVLVFIRMLARLVFEED